MNGGSGQVGIGAYLYLSGTTIFTLGYGDVTPTHSMGRLLAVAESGLGFGFLAAILSYLPALFQAYSRREVSISLLDARAGSPPSAAQLILRAARAGSTAAIDPFLAEWDAGRPSCSKASYRSPCWLTTVRSTTTSPGWPR